MLRAVRPTETATWMDLLPVGEVECRLRSDHVYMLISILLKYMASQVVGDIKGKIAIQIVRTYGEHKQIFWLAFLTRVHIVLPD